MILRSKDPATAQAWFSAIHASVSELLPRAISEVREQLGKAGLAGGREIRHLGWLAEKVRKRLPSFGVSSGLGLQAGSLPSSPFGFLVCSELRSALCMEQRVCLTQH